MAPIISVVGKRSSGKTTFICKIIKELKRRKYQVGVIKHSPDGFDIDKTKDNSKFYNEGADITVAVSEKEMLLLKRLQNQKLPDIIDNYFRGMDIVLIEGYKFEKYPKILIYSEDKELSYSNIFAVISDTKIKGMCTINTNEIKEVVDMIEKKYLTKKEEVEVKIDNKKIPLNPFVQSIIKNSILGMLKCLKGGEEKGDISIKIRR